MIKFKIHLAALHAFKIWAALHEVCCLLSDKRTLVTSCNIILHIFLFIVTDILPTKQRISRLWLLLFICLH